MAELTDHEKAIKAMLRQRHQERTEADAKAVADEAAEIQRYDELLSNSVDSIKQQKDKAFEKFMAKRQEDEYASLLVFEHAQASFQQAKAVRDAELVKFTTEYARKATEITDSFKLQLDQAREDRNVFSKRKIEIEEGWKKRKEATELQAMKEMIMALDDISHKANEDIILLSQENNLKNVTSLRRAYYETPAEHQTSENFSLNAAVPSKNPNEVRHTQSAMKMVHEAVGNGSTIDLPLKSESKIKLIHKGGVYTSPPCMQGVPVEKISEPVEGDLVAQPGGLQQYWERKWKTTQQFLNNVNVSVQEMQTAIKKARNGLTKLEGEAKNEAETDLRSLRTKLANKKFQMVPCQKTIDYFSTQDIHLNQLLSKDYIQGSGLIGVGSLKTLQTIFSILISAKEMRIIDVEPVHWLRIRLAERIEETAAKGNFALKTALVNFLSSYVEFRKIARRLGRWIGSNNKDEEREDDLESEIEMNSPFPVIEQRSKDQAVETKIGNKRNSISAQLPASERNVKSRRTLPVSFQKARKASNIIGNGFCSPSNSVKNITGSVLEKSEALKGPIDAALALKAVRQLRYEENSRAVSNALDTATTMRLRTDATTSATIANHYGDSFMLVFLCCQWKVWERKAKMSFKHNIYSNVLEAFQDNSNVGESYGSRGLETDPMQVSMLIYKKKRNGDTVILRRSSGILRSSHDSMEMTFESAEVASRFVALLCKLNPKIAVRHEKLLC